MQEAPPSSVITELDHTPPQPRMGAEGHSAMPMADAHIMGTHLFHLQIKPARFFFIVQLVAHILENVKDPKVGILYQNDDYGKDYVDGLRQKLGDKADSIIVAEGFLTGLKVMNVFNVGAEVRASTSVGQSFALLQFLTGLMVGFSKTSSVAM